MYPSQFNIARRLRIQKEKYKVQGISGMTSNSLRARSRSRIHFLGEAVSFSIKAINLECISSSLLNYQELMAVFSNHL